MLILKLVVNDFTPTTPFLDHVPIAHLCHLSVRFELLTNKLIQHLHIAVMSGWMTNMFGKRDSKQSAKEAIVTLREQLAMLDKKEEHLEKRIEEEHKKAKTLVAAHKTGKPSATLITSAAAAKKYQLTYACTHENNVWR